MGDFALIWDPALGDADLSILADDIESDEGLRTASLLSIFTDRRANDDDPLPGDADDKRGWWGDAFLEDPNDRMGGRRWLLARTKITRDLLPRIEAYDRESLQWMLDDRVVSRTDYEYEIKGEHLYTRITHHRPGRDAVSFRFAHVWDGEADRPSVLVLPPTNLAPTAGFTFTVAGLTATITDTSTDPEGDETIVSRSMDWGDGGAPETLAGSGPWTHEYTTYDTFEVTLTVTDDGGLTDDFVDSVTTALIASVAELYATANPAQAIIDRMSYATLPDYLWLGNATDGAWIDVRSGLSLAKVSTPAFQQPDARFGGADTIKFDATNRGFVDSVNDGSLDIGSGDYQLISIHALNVLATGYMHFKFDTRGYRNYTLGAGGQMHHNVTGASGSATASIAVDHGTTNPQTMLFTKSAAGTKVFSREGSATSATATGNADVASGAAFKLGLGLSSAMQSNMVLHALWIGTGDLTETERLALATGLGLE